jgi:hypothetical protein
MCAEVTRNETLYHSHLTSLKPGLRNYLAVCNSIPLNFDVSLLLGAPVVDVIHDKLAPRARRCDLT